MLTAMEGLVTAKFFNAALDQSLTKAQWIIEQLNCMRDNIELREGIIKQAGSLRELLEQLERSSDLPRGIEDCLDHLRDHLRNCEDLIKNSGQFIEFLQARDERTRLVQLRDELIHAISRAQFSVTTTHYQLSQQEFRRARRNSSGQFDGVFFGLQSTPPLQIRAEAITADVRADKFLTIAWDDQKNNPKDVAGYEVEYDEAHELSVRIDKTESGQYKPADKHFKVTLGKPKVHPGGVYSIRVRALNGSGPGEWSEPIVCEIPQPPPTPSTPTIQSVHLEAEDENTDDVSAVIVVSKPQDSENVTACIIDVYPPRSSLSSESSCSQPPGRHSMSTIAEEASSLQSSTTSHYNRLSVQVEVYERSTEVVEGEGDGAPDEQQDNGPSEVQPAEPLDNSTPPEIQPAEPPPEIQPAEPLDNSGPPEIQPAEPLDNSGPPEIQPAEPLDNSGPPEIQPAEPLDNSGPPEIQPVEPLDNSGPPEIQPAEPLDNSGPPEIQPAERLDNQTECMDRQHVEPKEETPKSCRWSHEEIDVTKNSTKVQSEGANLRITLSNFRNGKQCSFRATMRNQDGRKSIPSSIFTIPKGELLPGSPTKLEVIDYSHNAVDLSWGSPMFNKWAAKKYQVQVRTRTGSWRVARELVPSDETTCEPTTTGRCSISRLRSNTEYFFRVCSVAESGCKSPFSKEVSRKTKPHPVRRGLQTVSITLFTSLTAPITVPIAHITLGLDQVDRYYKPQDGISEQEERERKANAAFFAAATVLTLPFCFVLSPVLGPAYGYALSEYVED